MIKRVFALLVVFNLSACAELQNVINELPQTGGLSNEDMAAGLRQALDFGIDKQVTKLTQKNGFYKNELVKILIFSTVFDYPFVNSKIHYEFFQ